MTKEIFEKAVKFLEEDCERKKKELIRNYAIANNPYKVGDVVRDQSTTIHIEKIKVYLSYSDPCCVYSGHKLKKNGEIMYKRGTTFPIMGSVYQSNIVK